MKRQGTLPGLAAAALATLAGLGSCMSYGYSDIQVAASYELRLYAYAKADGTQSGGFASARLDAEPGGYLGDLLRLGGASGAAGALSSMSVESYAVAPPVDEDKGRVVYDGTGHRRFVACQSSTPLGVRLNLADFPAGGAGGYLDGESLLLLVGGAAYGLDGAGTLSLRAGWKGGAETSAWDSGLGAGGKIAGLVLWPGPSRLVLTDDAGSAPAGLEIGFRAKEAALAPGSSPGGFLVGAAYLALDPFTGLNAARLALFEWDGVAGALRVLGDFAADPGLPPDLRAVGSRGLYLADENRVALVDAGGGRSGEALFPAASDSWWGTSGDEGCALTPAGTWSADWPRGRLSLSTARSLDYRDASLALRWRADLPTLDGYLVGAALSGDLILVLAALPGGRATVTERVDQGF